MALRIQNHTDYRTDDLRRFFWVGLLARGASLNKTIKVIYARRKNGVAGRGRLPYAGVEGDWIRMSLPRPASLEVHFKSVAQVFQHEVDHTLGLKHQDMMPWWEMEVAWATPDLIFREREKLKDAPKVEKREAGVRAKVEEYENKLVELERAKARYLKLLRK